MNPIDRVKEMGTGGKFAPAIAATLPFEVSVAEEGRVILEMDVKEEYGNPMRSLHGGVISYLADTAMGFAFATTLTDKIKFTSVDLNMEFLRPVFTGKLRAEGKVIKSGSTLALLEARLYDDKETLVAFGTSTIMNLK